MGILRGFCTHVWKAALGDNCCMQHAISGNLPSSAVMFLDLPWFSDSKLPLPSLFRLVHGVLFPFLLSVYSMTLDKAVQCLSVVSSFTQHPSRPVWECFEWKKRTLHFNRKHVGFRWRWSFNLQLYNIRRFCCQGTEWCISDGTVGGRLAPLPAQILSLDDPKILPVAKKVLLCFWLDFSIDRKSVV